MSKTFAVVGYTYNAAVYCPSCAESIEPDHGLPVACSIKEIAENDGLDGGPIFRDSESDTVQHCANCTNEIDNTVIGGA